MPEVYDGVIACFVEALGISTNVLAAKPTE
jgi:hypothetical protein